MAAEKTAEMVSQSATQQIEKCLKCEAIVRSLGENPHRLEQLFLLLFGIN
jgi:hypothetical protein